MEKKEANLPQRKIVIVIERGVIQQLNVVVVSIKNTCALSLTKTYKD